LTLANGVGTDIVIHEDSAASKRQLISAKGLAGVGSLRESKRVRPSAHGSLNETAFEEGRTISLVGEVMSQVSIENAIEEFRKISGVFLESLDNGGALMKWTEGVTGLKLQMLVTLDSECEPTYQEAAAFLNYPVSFFADDPRAYAQALTTQAGATVTGNTVQTEWANGAEAPSGVAISSTFIYFTEEKNKLIQRYTLAGTEQKLLVSGLAAGPTCIAVDSAHIYWGHGSSIGRATLAGGTVEPEWITNTGMSRVTGIAVNATNIYWIGERTVGIGNYGIGRATVAGTEAAEWTTIPLAIPRWKGGLRLGLAIDGTFLYFGTAGGVGRTALASPSPEPNWIPGEELGETTGVAVNASSVFWVNRSRNRIGKAQLSGATPSNTYITGAGEYGMAANASNIFWGETAHAVARGEVGTGSPSGSSVTVAQSGNRPTPLVFKIEGAITNPSVIRQSDGARLAFKGVIVAGHFWEADTAAKRLLVDGTTPFLKVLDAPNTDWSKFAAPPTPSTETYTLAGTTATGAVLKVLSRSAYA
jgi:hypothetical protein